jgi:hypothetical protein
MKLADLLEQKEEVDCSKLKKGMFVKYFNNEDELVYGFFEYKDNKGFLWFIREDGSEDKIECKDVVKVFSDG